MNILDRIVARKKEEIRLAKDLISIDLLSKESLFDRTVNRLSTQLKQSQQPEIIAEFKRQSPSKGAIHPNANPKDIATLYATKAAAISCLTDKDFFGARTDDFTTIRQQVNTPLLRKEFIIDPYQVYETKAMGADIILLIAECLDAKQVQSLATLAQQLGLDVLLEIHSEEQLPKVCDEINILGINNRNLKTFEVNIEHSISIAHSLPPDIIKISESGLSKPETVLDLYKEGFKGFLMGENFMKQSDPGQAFTEFCQQIHTL